MRGRVLNEEMVAWVSHLLYDTAWEPDRQAAADLLATIQYLMENEGALPGQPIVPPGLAAPKPLNAQGEVVAQAGTKSQEEAEPPPAKKRPVLTLVPPVTTDDSGSK